MGMGQDRKAYLTGHHKHGEDKDETGFGHREPAGLLEGKEYGSIQAGLGGAGRDSRGYQRAQHGSGLCISVPGPLLQLPPASPSSHLTSEWEVGRCPHGTKEVVSLYAVKG